MRVLFFGIFINTNSFYDYKEDINSVIFEENNIHIKINGKNQRWGKGKVVEFKNLIPKEITKLREIFESQGVVVN